MQIAGLKAFDVTAHISSEQANPLNAAYTRAKSIRLVVNVHPMVDIPTGRPVMGFRGERFISGGVSPFTGIGGLPNHFKTAVMIDSMLSFIEHYFPLGYGMMFDCEDSASSERPVQLAGRFPRISAPEYAPYIREKFLITNTNKAEGGNSGGDFFAKLRKFAKETRGKKAKKYASEILDTDLKVLGKHEPYKSLVPMFLGMDSISMFPIEKVEEMYAGNMVGSSDLNTEAMKASSAKSQMLTQIPNFANEYKVYVLATAHLGKAINMDPRQPPAKQLSWLQENIVFKNTPEKFRFLTNNCWVNTNLSQLLDKDKLPEYPRSPGEGQKMDRDMVRITSTNTRGKNGPSGDQIMFIASQREGVDWDVSSWHWLREKSDFGIQSPRPGFYFLDILPDVMVTRKTLRTEIRENMNFRTALRFTVAIHMIRHFWGVNGSTLWYTPAEIYSRLTELGYDWDILLNTRFYSTFQEAAPYHQHPLTALDLFAMVGIEGHKPYWYDAEVKRVEKEKAKQAATVAKSTSPEDVVSAALAKASSNETLPTQ